MPFTEEELEGKYPHRDKLGRHLRDNLMGPGTTDGESGQAWKGCDPTKYGRCWSAPKTGKYARYLNDVLLPGYLDIAGVHDRLNALDDAGMIHWTSGGVPLLKRYAMPGQGTVPGNIWTDIPPLSRKTKERVGYPTQKPIALLDRIIRASSNEGDTVLDPFCGCATAAVAAERLQREWIGIDISAKAAELVTTRLQGILDEIPLYKTGDVVHRTDQPGRTDLGDLPHYRTHLDSLYGAQEGFCGGCGEHFRKRNLTVDHIVPRAHGGTDHAENLWLLCAACNSSKGTRSQEQFLRERMKRHTDAFPWLIN